MAYVSRAKRLLLGKALPTQQRKREAGRFGAIAGLGSDALSSNVYATQEILILLAVGGFGVYAYGPAVAACVVVVFAVVVAAYRYTVREYPTGGADYAVARRNLGQSPAAVVGAAMLIDFALTLAVSTTAIIDTIVSIAPALYEARVLLALGVIVLMAILSLRGSASIAALLQAGTWAFVAAILVTAVAAGVQVLLDDRPRAVSAEWDTAEPTTGLAGLALLVVLARAFSSGSIAVTGVEAIGTGAPSLQRPRGERAAMTVVLVGAISMVLFASITWLALLTGVKATADNADLIGLPAGEPQQTVVVQVVDAVFGSSWVVLAAVIVTVAILGAAAMSAFRSFSVLSSVLAKDGFLPRQLQSRGDRLVYSNGILVLAVAAGLLVWAFDARLTALIQLYVVGVFLALTLGQAGMVRHWSRRLRGRMPAEERGPARRGRAVAGVAQFVTGAVLVVVLISKFTAGAWLVVLLVPLLAAAMRAVREHYDTVAYALAAEEQSVGAPSSEVIALILVSRIHKPTLRAIAYARASRPTAVEAITVAVDEQEARQLAATWAESEMPVPLQVLQSPFREINNPVTDYVAVLASRNPEALLTIYMPEYVVAHWWERLLHNQSAARLKLRLMSLPNVMVVTVPWQRASEAEDVPAGIGRIRGGVTGMTGAIPRIETDPRDPRTGPQ